MVEVRTKMKSRLMLPSFLVLLSLAALFLVAYPALAGEGCGSNWLGSDNNDQDFWVSKNQNLGSSVVALNEPSSKPRIPPDERPQALPSSSGPNMSMPEPSPKPLVAKNETAKNETAQNSSSAALNNSTNASARSPPTPQPLDVGGKWMVKLDNSTDRALDLIIIQDERDIMASGNLITDGAEIPVTGHGSLEDKDLSLKVKTVVREYGNQIDKRYDLDLAVGNGSLSGKYKEYSGDKPAGEGRANAIQ
jgi:hypothetical protein